MPCRYLSLNSVNKNGVINCKLVSNLNKHHLEICQTQPQVIRTVGLGMQIAIDECQRQFRRDRWNCPTMDNSITKSVFGNILDKGNYDLSYNSFLWALVNCYISSCYIWANSHIDIPTLQVSDSIDDHWRSIQQNRMMEYHWKTQKKTIQTHRSNSL